MFYEILLWTLGMIGGSHALPNCIPSIRSAYKQIHASIKANTVFTSECISDIQQGQLDFIDRTIGQLMSAICQTAIVLWASLNLLTGWSIDPLHNFVVAYYLYDMIYLYLKPYGKMQRIFFLHHALSIFLIIYTRYAELHHVEFFHVSYICMELSGCSINITHLLRYSFPISKLNITISAINLLLYGVTRLVIYGFALLNYIVTTDITPIYYIPTILLYLLYFVSLYWCILMAQKHKRLQHKIIL